MKKLMSLSVVLALALLMSGWLANERKSIAQQSATVGFPGGDWRFSAHPYMGEGFRTRPVVVTSVASEATTLSVTGVRINNISSKGVLAVKLGWSIYDQRNRTKILNQGESSLITLDRVLRSDSDQRLSVPLVSFMEIHKRLMKKGRLEGDYRLDVAVTEILFDDHSTWQVGQPVSTQSDVALISVGYSKGLDPIIVTPLKVPDACAKQSCVYDAGPPPGYSCGGSTNEEFCTNCDTTCCNTVCGYVPQCNCH